MQRLMVLLMGCAVLGTLGHLSRLHTHGYTDHVLSDHRHGLAAHAHQVSARHVDTPGHPAGGDDAVHVESCDPARHQVSFSVGAVPATTVYAFDADSATTPPIVPLRVARATRSVTDVRVHGPPALRHGPSRAPPQLFPA